MKSFFFSSLLISTSAIAQSIDTSALKSLLTSRKASLERVNPGMTKKVITTSKLKLASGDCGYMLTSIQSVLKIETDKMIVFSKEKFSPQNSPACRAAGLNASTEESILFYNDKPTLSKELAELDLASNEIKSIFKNNELITLNLITESVDDSGASVSDNISITHDLTKPSFKKMVISQGMNFKTVTEDLADIDLKTVNLTKVLFCDDNDGDNSDCSEGDYSDILY